MQRVVVKGSLRTGRHVPGAGPVGDLPGKRPLVVDESAQEIAQRGRGGSPYPLLDLVIRARWYAVSE